MTANSDNAHSAQRVGFTVRGDPWFPGCVIVDTVDGEGLGRSFVVPPQAAMDLSYELFCAAVERGAMPWLPSGDNKAADRG